jgi:hypothetical protein
MAGTCAISGFLLSTYIYDATQSLTYLFTVASQVPPHPTQHFEFDMSGVRDAETRGCQVVRLFEELYIDAFGVFQKKYYSPEGIYVTLGNLSREERNKLENIWCVGMKPPNTSEEECLDFFVQDKKKLQRGFYVQLQNDKLVFVIGGLGIVKAGSKFESDAFTFLASVSISICSCYRVILKRKEFIF